MVTAVRFFTATALEATMLVIDSPDAVRAVFLSHSVVRMVGVNDQVLVGVMSRGEVSDHTAGDAQETHHCRQSQYLMKDI